MVCQISVEEFLRGALVVETRRNTRLLRAIAIFREGVEQTLRGGLLGGTQEGRHLIQKIRMFEFLL